ncbi:MAG: hypothetical protein OXB92_11800 [Acidimicrobiaceae bacterium]|nr:hypothetical protein [Acidimicrobiaceae bacterium]
MRPVEVKLGSARRTSLPPLDRIAGPNWTTGQVVSLAAEDEPAAITDQWTLCAPEDLDPDSASSSIP